METRESTGPGLRLVVKLKALELSAETRTHEKGQINNQRLPKNCLGLRALVGAQSCPVG